jgi:hypothetical protein
MRLKCTSPTMAKRNCEGTVPAELTAAIFFALLAAIADILSVVGAIQGSSKVRPVIRHVILMIVIAGLTAFAAYQYRELQIAHEAQRAAQAYISQWSADSSVRWVSSSSDRKMEMIYGGLGLLEKHKHNFPGSYDRVSELVKSKVESAGAPKNSTEREEQGRTLSDGAAAIFGLVRELAR